MVTSMGYKKHFGSDKLVVQLDNGKLYQAGEFLEKQTDKLFLGTKLLLTGTRLNRNTRRKFVVCNIVQNGDWAGLLDYKKVNLLPMHRETKSQVLDFKSVNVKGTKRKLVLLDNGDIFKLKKSKLEDTVSFGDLL